MRSLIESVVGSLCGGHRASDINAAPANTVKLFTSCLMSGGAAERSLSNWNGPRWASALVQLDQQEGLQIHSVLEIRWWRF